MAVQEIPVNVIGNSFRFGTVLDGKRFVFLFRWNSRTESWYFDLSDGTNELIRSGLRVVTFCPLLYGLIDTRGPNGEIGAFTYDGSLTPPGLDDFGVNKRVHLIYVPRSV